MGYRLTSSTWRAPIQLIDSWLPDPRLSESPRTAFRVTQLFSRVGWIGRRATNPGLRTPASITRHPPVSPAPAAKPCFVRVLRQPGADNGCRPDTRLVISGRIGDVCAELDRLASLESRQKRLS